MSKFVFSFETTDFYGEDDKSKLLAAFREVLNDFDEDEDVIEDSTLVEASGDSDGEVSDAVKKQVIDDFVANAQIEFQVQARFRDGENKTVGSAVAAQGFLS